MNTALLVMDMQTGILDMMATDKAPLLGRTSELIAAARKAGALVVYVVLGFRKGHPEIGASSGMFATVRQNGLFVEGTAGTEIHEALAPKPGDVVVTKHRVSAFAGTDLEMILRANRIETLVLSGVATSGIVLSTVRHAADADYGLIVARDCCADRDEEVHRVLLEKVFPRQAKVVASAEIFA
ncbi:MAG TPA: isochorismatase family cysteine hydrolase [Labilithrix sp.]